MLITIYMNFGDAPNRFDGNLFKFDEHDIRGPTAENRHRHRIDKVSKGEGPNGINSERKFNKCSNKIQ